ncbi:MAG: hypothetical protein ACRC2S_15715 [Waterburya sp.]
MLSNFYQSRRLSKIIHTLKFLLLILLTVSVANSAVAESLNEYCISQVSPQEVAKPRENSEEVESSIPPFINSIENLPQIYKNPCNILSIECIRKTFFSYSPTLDRVFIQGYRKTFLGRGFVHLEISKSGTKSVPDALIESGFAEDIPELNGVLFSGHSEALFYDGSKVTNLSAYFPKLKWKKEARNWWFEKTSEGRMFLVGDFIDSKGYPFLMELKPGLDFTFISVPKELKNTYVQLFTLPNSSRLLVVTKNALLTEFNGKLQNVIIISSPFGITDTAYVEQLVDGSIAFKIQNENTKSITNYVLKHTSSTANCEIMLNPDKPVLLQPESEINNHKQSRVNIDKIVNSLLKFFKIVD